MAGAGHALLCKVFAGIGALLQLQLQTCVKHGDGRHMFWHASTIQFNAMHRSAWSGCAGGACSKAGRYGGARCGADARAPGEEGPQGPLCGFARLGRQFCVLAVRAYLEMASCRRSFRFCMSMVMPNYPGCTVGG